MDAANSDCCKVDDATGVRPQPVVLVLEASKVEHRDDVEAAKVESRDAEERASLQHGSAKHNLFRKWHWMLVFGLFSVIVATAIGIALIVSMRADPQATKRTNSKPTEVDVLVNADNLLHAVDTPIANRTFTQAADADVNSTLRFEVILTGHKYPKPLSMSVDSIVKYKRVEGGGGRRLDGTNVTDLDVIEFVDSSNAKTSVMVFGRNLTSISCLRAQSGDLSNCQFHDAKDNPLERRLASKGRIQSKRKDPAPAPPPAPGPPSPPAPGPVAGAAKQVGIQVVSSLIIQGIVEVVNCFPGAARVITLGGGSKFMRDLRVNDLVLTATGYSAVYMMGHSDSFVLTDFIRIHTSTGHALSLSADHYMHFANGSLALASHVQVGDAIVVLDSAQVLIPANVTEISASREMGLYNPYPYSGTIVVDGVLASAHSGWFLEDAVPMGQAPSIYNAVLSPVRLLHSLFPGWLERFAQRTAGHGALSEQGVGNIVGAAIRALST